MSKPHRKAEQAMKKREKFALQQSECGDLQILVKLAASGKLQSLSLPQKVGLRGTCSELLRGKSCTLIQKIFKHVLNFVWLRSLF